MSKITDNIKEKVLLAPLSTFKIGGPADYFYNLENAKDLPKLLKFAQDKQIPFIVIGGGSNLLFSEKGFRGLIIHMSSKNLYVDNEKITADAGVLLSQVVQTAFKNNLCGIETWIGLPGTVGGAVRGNAGANGVEVKDVLKKAEIFNTKTGKIEEADNNFFQFAYRESYIKHHPEIIVLKAAFILKNSPQSRAEQQKLMTEILRDRQHKQPKGQNAGSFFKNPSLGKSAGWLIEQVGLKGRQIGDARISPIHANFFENLGNATQKQILGLAELAQKKVEEKFKITLEKEVQIIPEVAS